MSRIPPVLAPLLLPPISVDICSHINGSSCDCPCSSGLFSVQQPKESFRANSPHSTFLYPSHSAKKSGAFPGLIQGLSRPALSRSPNPLSFLISSPLSSSLSGLQPAGLLAVSAPSPAHWHCRVFALSVLSAQRFLLPSTCVIYFLTSFWSSLKCHLSL